jgi:hypothetical protein
MSETARNALDQGTMESLLFLFLLLSRRTYKHLIFYDNEKKARAREERYW